MYDSLAGWANEELTVALRDVEARQRQLDAERSALLVEWDRRKAWANDGSATAAARLARETIIAGATARDRVKVALSLPAMPATAAAFDALGWAKVRLLAHARQPRTADAFDACETILVDHAHQLSVDQLAVFLLHWRRLVDEDGANADADSMHDDQYLRVDRSWRGEGFLKGRLDPEATAILTNALDAIAEELYRAERRAACEARLRGEQPPPGRSASNRYAHALLELTRRGMATTDAEAAGATVTPARPLVLVTIDADDEGAVRARFADGSPTSTHDAARAACDAAVARVVVRDGCVPLYLGRTTRDPTEAQRRALAAIWATCAYPSCDRPFAWTQLHHVWHWTQGGPTDVDWLLPLCSTHHRTHHRGLYTITRHPDGTFQFDRADWTPIGPANPTISRLLDALRRLPHTA